MIIRLSQPTLFFAQNRHVHSHFRFVYFDFFNFIPSLGNHFFEAYLFIYKFGFFFLCFFELTFDLSQILVILGG